MAVIVVEPFCKQDRFHQVLPTLHYMLHYVCSNMYTVFGLVVSNSKQPYPNFTFEGLHNRIQLRKLYPSLCHRLSSKHYHCVHSRMGCDYSCCARGCRFRSHLGCIGFHNTEDTFKYSAIRLSCFHNIFGVFLT